MSKYTRSERISHFWSRVNIKGLLDCWEWQGYRTQKGYGQVKAAHKVEIAHRFAWEITVGVIPSGIHCLHKCDNPSCVNPNHLYLGTNADNVNDRSRRRRAAKGMKNGRAKLTDNDVRQIRRLLALGHTGRVVAAKFGVTPGMVSHIKRQANWKHIQRG